MKFTAHSKVMAASRMNPLLSPAPYIRLVNASAERRMLARLSRPRVIGGKYSWDGASVP
jgi:hypothetical protein